MLRNLSFEILTKRTVINPMRGKIIDRKIFVDVLDVIIKILHPIAIIIYGFCPDHIFDKYNEQGIRIIHFKPDYYCQLSLEMEVD